MRTPMTTLVSQVAPPSPRGSRPIGAVASGPKVSPAGSRVEPFPSRRLSEVLKAINPGITDGV
jgi:hypothetical protein